MKRILGYVIGIEYPYREQELIKTIRDNIITSDINSVIFNSENYDFYESYFDALDTVSQIKLRKDDIHFSHSNMVTTSVNAEMIENGKHCLMEMDINRLKIMEVTIGS